MKKSELKGIIKDIIQECIEEKRMTRADLWKKAQKIHSDEKREKYLKRFKSCGKHDIVYLATSKGCPECLKNAKTKTNELDEEKERDYKAEYANYHSKPEQKKNRAKRNAARRKFEKEGRVHKGDGKDVDHKRKLRSGGSNSNSNLRVRDRHSNRGDK